MSKKQTAEIAELKKRVNVMEKTAENYGVYFNYTRNHYGYYSALEVMGHYSVDDNPEHAADRARVVELETGIQTAMELFGVRDKYASDSGDYTGMLDYTSPTQEINAFLADLAVVAEELAAEREETARYKKTTEARTRLGVRTERKN